MSPLCTSKIVNAPSEVSSISWGKVRACLGDKGLWTLSHFETRFSELPWTSEEVSTTKNIILKIVLPRDRRNRFHRYLPSHLVSLIPKKNNKAGIPSRLDALLSKTATMILKPVINRVPSMVLRLIKILPYDDRFILIVRNNDWSASVWIDLKLNIYEILYWQKKTARFVPDYFWLEKSSCL